MKTKECEQCGETKPNSQFPFKNGGKICRLCTNVPIKGTGQIMTHERDDVGKELREATIPELILKVERGIAI